MKRVYEAMDIMYNGLHKKDYDAVYGMFGDEGTGKSNMLLHLLEYWVTKKYGKVTAEDIKYIQLNIVDWAKSLSDVNKGDVCIWDEGGELSNKRSISNLNLAITQAYNIIRGDNLFSLIGMPSPFDLDGYFTKRRMRGMFFVYGRGRVAFWSRDRLRKVIALNQYKRVKSVWVVKPTFFDTFPKYKGVLTEPYADKKKEFMKDTRRELYETIKKIKGGEDNAPSERDALIIKSQKQNGSTMTAKAFSLSPRQIRRIVKANGQQTED